MIREFIKYAKQIETAYNTAIMGNKRVDMLLQEKMRLIIEMIRYIRHGEWTRKSSREKFNAWIKSGFDTDVICKCYNTTRASLDVFIHRQNRRLESYLSEAFELIKIDRLQEARVSFYARTHCVQADNLFGYRLIELLPKASLEQWFQLDECREEILLLRRLMKNNLGNRIKSLDK